MSLGAIGASPVAAAYPELRFGAVVFGMAPKGAASAVALTTTPTGWLLCGNDDNPEVDNGAAVANSAALAARGIPTVVDLHPASPLYDERFAREPGIAPADVAGARPRAACRGLRRRGRIRSTESTPAITAAVTANPALLPTFASLAPSVRNEVVDQIRAMQAEHQMYSDWAMRAVAFLDAHNP